MQQISNVLSLRWLCNLINTYPKSNPPSLNRTSHPIPVTAFTMSFPHLTVCINPVFHFQKSLYYFALGTWSLLRLLADFPISLSIDLFIYINIYAFIYLSIYLLIYYVTIYLPVHICMDIRFTFLY